MEVHVVAMRDTETGFIRALKHLHSPEPKSKPTQTITDFWTLFSCQDQTLWGATKREVQVLKLERKRINKVKLKRTLLKWATFPDCWWVRRWLQFPEGTSAHHRPYLPSLWHDFDYCLPPSPLPTVCYSCSYIQMAFYVELCLQLIPGYMSSTEIKTLVIFKFSRALTSWGKIYIYICIHIYIYAYTYIHIFKPLQNPDLWLYASHDKHNYQPNTTVLYKDDE